MAELTRGSAELFFLPACEPDEVAALRSHASTRRYAAGTAIFHELEAPSRVYIVLSGFVRLSRVSEEGREVILAIRGPGDLLGEQSAIDGMPRSATAVAHDDVSVLVLSALDFLAFIRENPRVALVLLKMLSQRLREADLKRVGLSVQDTV